MTYGMSRDEPMEDRHCHKRPVELRGYDVSDTLAHGLRYIPAPGILNVAIAMTVGKSIKIHALALAALRTMMVTQALPY